MESIINATTGFDFWKTIIDNSQLIIIALISMISSYFIAKTPKKGDIESTLLDKVNSFWEQDRKEKSEIQLKIRCLEDSLNALEKKEISYISYISLLRSHITNEEPPPVPEIPEKLKGSL